MEAPDFSGRPPSGLASADTRSQFYMWEPANPGERDDFEEDVIASTSEVVYNNFTRLDQKRLFLDDETLIRRSIEEAQQRTLDVDLPPIDLSAEAAADFELELELEMEELFPRDERTHF